jgi:hypothetical protein
MFFLRNHLLFMRIWFCTLFNHREQNLVIHTIEYYEQRNLLLAMEDVWLAFKLLLLFCIPCPSFAPFPPPPPWLITFYSPCLKRRQHLMIGAMFRCDVRNKKRISEFILLQQHRRITMSNRLPTPSLPNKVPFGR